MWGPASAGPSRPTSRYDASASARFLLVSMRPWTVAPSTMLTDGAEASPSTDAVSRRTMLLVALNLPLTCPDTTIASADTVAAMWLPAAIVRVWPLTVIDPSTWPAMVSGSDDVMSPLSLIDAPMWATFSMVLLRERRPSGNRRSVYRIFE